MTRYELDATLDSFDERLQHMLDAIRRGESVAQDENKPQIALCDFPLDNDPPPVVL